jgi:hypothetical protein
MHSDCSSANSQKFTRRKSLFIKEKSGKKGIQRCSWVIGHKQVINSYKQAFSVFRSVWKNIASLELPVHIQTDLPEGHCLAIC